jgi:hypothetical protein
VDLGGAALLDNLGRVRVRVTVTVRISYDHGYG